MTRRRICVATGSRADYGPLRPLIRRLHDDPDVDLELIVSGGHLLEEQGMTVKAIQNDGFDIDSEIEMILAGDSPHAVGKSFGLAALGYADALKRLDPDILVVLGDRYEALAIAAVAALSRVPIAHVAGGQVTEGAIDDSIRHAITKLAHVHFTSTHEFRRRILQLGEQPDRVYVVGALGLDNVLAEDLPGRRELLAELAVRDRGRLVVVTYHPATADPKGTQAGLEGLLAALEQVPDASVVFTVSNVDSDGRRLNRAVLEFAHAHSDRVYVHQSLGHRRYLGLLRCCDVVIGNSSSALIEAPALRTPTVNIGSRQKGRLRADSVIDCGESAAMIVAAIERALSPGHRKVAEAGGSPYGDGKAACRIQRHLKELPLEVLLSKRFADLGGGEDSAAG